LSRFTSEKHSARRGLLFEEVGPGTSPAELKMQILFHCVIVAVIVLVVAYAIDHAPIDETRSRTRPRMPSDGEHR
jgi:hypothetical protein